MDLRWCVPEVLGKAPASHKWGVLVHVIIPTTRKWGRGAEVQRHSRLHRMLETCWATWYLVENKKREGSELKRLLSWNAFGTSNLGDIIQQHGTLSTRGNRGLTDAAQPSSQESTEPHTAKPKRGQKRKSEGQFLLNACCFPITVSWETICHIMISTSKVAYNGDPFWLLTSGRRPNHER